MEDLSNQQLQKQQQALVKIERQIEQLLPKLQECSNMLKVEELQLKSSILDSAFTTRPMTVTTAMPTNQDTTTVPYNESEFKVNQQEILLDMVLKIRQEEEEDSD